MPGRPNHVATKPPSGIRTSIDWSFTELDDDRYKKALDVTGVCRFN